MIQSHVNQVRVRQFHHLKTPGLRIGAIYFYKYNYLDVIFNQHQQENKVQF